MRAIDWSYSDIAEMKGKTLKSVTKEGNSDLLFETIDGERYVMTHIQDCCESVFLEDIAGDLEDLVGSPLIEAEEVSDHDDPPKPDPDFDDYEPESYTWTFYKLGTAKGFVTIRWYGESNGYYSETADFLKIRQRKDDD